MPSSENQNQWVTERSRAMWADLGATPGDSNSQRAIVERHVRDAAVERPHTPGGEAALRCLLLATAPDMSRPTLVEQVYEHALTADAMAGVP